MRKKDDTSLIPSLPFMDVKDFIDFDKKLLLNDKITSQLKNIIYGVGGKNFPSFLRMALKSIISDAMAVNLTWRGTNDKPSIQRFTTFALIKSNISHKTITLKKSINSIFLQMPVIPNIRTRPIWI
ncbi:uncharacterized protein LOC120780299 [Bactrocera tryoni]|uniref:uncharacterized protein LOC120780299 n=1 Tax=Bactrocera tryoni TaxID=59916 RepID=UPI001A95B782|nr:uncharacterized protein LOC120780299 [Bactrocera tryoni]